MDISLIGGAIGSLKAAGDIAKSLLDMKNSHDISAKVAQIQSTLLEAQALIFEANSAQTSLIQKIRDLEQDIVRMKTWDTEKQRYKLSTPKSGLITYALKQSMSNGEPPHYLCTNCYENGRKSILHQRPEVASNGFTYFLCSNCPTKIPVGHRGMSTVVYAPE